MYCKCAKLDLIKKRERGLRCALPPKQNDNTCFHRQCCSLNMVLTVFIMPNMPPCEHVECRLGMVEAPQCWVKNGANSCIECYDSVGLGFV